MRKIIIAETFEYSELDQLKDWLRKTPSWVLIFGKKEIEVIPISEGSSNCHEQYICNDVPVLCINRHNDDIHELYNSPCSAMLKHFIDALEVDYTIIN